MKRKQSLGIIIVLFLLSCPILFITQKANAELSNPAVLQNHTPIFIVNDNCFNNSNGVRYGNGSMDNPYVIENWSIDAKYNLVIGLVSIEESVLSI